MSQLFAKICEDKENDYSVFLSYLQIYHERIYDLLDSTKETDLHLREHPDEGKHFNYLYFTSFSYSSFVFIIRL